MKITKAALLIGLVLPLASLPSVGVGQTAGNTGGPTVACPTQAELEQAIGSQGSIMPEECTTLQINSLSSENGELCLIDFGIDEGFLGRLRDAAFPTQWWVQCDDLAGTAQP